MCGDPFNGQRDHEPPSGKYAKGVIGATYQQGEVIRVNVQITANHLGYFEFRLCPSDNARIRVTQECLDRHVLSEAAGGRTKIPIDRNMIGNFYINLQLPSNISCTYCVLQWKYNTGNVIIYATSALTNVCQLDDKCMCS